MSAPDLEDEAVAVTQGSHLCGIYGSDAGRLELVVPFLLEGLLKQSVCFLIAPARPQPKILNALKKKRPSLSADIKARRLIVSEHQKSPAAQVRFFEIAMKKAQDKGVESFRLAGDMWGLRLLVSAKQMVHLELGLERVIVQRFPVVALCTYDARKFTGVELLDALRDHQDTLKYPIGRTLAR